MVITIQGILVNFKPLATFSDVILLTGRTLIVSKVIRILLLIDEINADIDELLVRVAIELVVSYEEVMMSILLQSSGGYLHAG